MLATPLIGFVIGAGGYLSFAVLKDTYTGKMPGPASAGYFIAAITGATVLGLTIMSRKQGFLAEDMSDELDMVMAQLYEIEDMKNPTPEDLTNYQNLLTRYYEMVRFNAEQKTARVRTMSGKPVSETLRKLKQDKNLSAKDARTRKEIKAENMEVFEAVSSNHDTYMKILSQVIKNHESYSASKDAYLINRYGLATMKRFMKWANNIGYSTYWCFTDAAREWLEGDEISSDDMKDIKALLRNLTDEKAKYQLATIVAKENSDLARIYNWTTDSQHKDVISLDKWDENQFVLDFLATDEEQESYYSQERLTLGSKNVSMILNLGDYEDEDDEATFFDEVSPKSGKIPRNLPNTASLLDYLENNAEQFEDMLHHNDGLNYVKQLRDLYGWSFAIHPAQKYIYEDDEIYIEWQLKRAIPAKKRQQLKLDSQKQIREFRARLLNNTGLEFKAENWGGDPDGQLAQALERARNSPAPPPLEITELPKICQLCGDESPQAFGLYDEDDQLVGEIWACDGGCAEPLADSRNLSFGAEEDYNFNDSEIMVIGEPTNLPDADSWIIYMHDSDERETDSRFADLFFVRGPGQFIRTSNYQKTAKVIGGYAPFHITQNLSRDGWLASSTTIANYTDEPDARSLSVGDVVCDADTGRFFIVANSGYLPLEPAELFEAPLARHPLNRFKKSTKPHSAGYWRKKGKESIFRRHKSPSNVK
jgi:hypothetical protein